MRFLVVLASTAVLAAVAASSASALAFTDDTRVLSNAALDSPYRGAVRARNGCTPYTFRVLGDAVMPPGLVFTPDGQITGTPTTQGRWQFWLAVDDSCGGESQRPFSIAVYPAPPPAEVGVTFSMPLRVDEAPDTQNSWWIASGALPPGLTLGSTGVIGGTPTAGGTFDVTLGVSNPHAAPGLPGLELTLVVAAPPAILTARAPAARVGRSYRSALRASGGTRPLSWRVVPGAGRLPPGIRLNGTLGTLLGIPRRAGRYPFAVLVHDRLGQTAARRLLLVVTGTAAA
jgi:hypothetical protein